MVHKWLMTSPDARAMFHFAAGDDFRNHPECINHGRNILNAVGAIVAGLRDFESLGPTMEHLGVAHARKNVGAEQFPPLGRAIMEAIKERLGDKWTPEVANAWESVYAAISVRIVSAMEAARAIASSPKPPPPPVRAGSGAPFAFLLSFSRTTLGGPAPASLTAPIAAPAAAAQVDDEGEDEVPVMQFGALAASRFPSAAASHPKPAARKSPPEGFSFAPPPLRPQGT